MLDKYQYIDLLPEDKGTIFGNYLNSAAYTDYAIGQLIQELKDDGIYDNSVIALYGDHLGLTKSDDEIKKSVSRFLGKEYDYDTMMNIPLIITVPGADREVNQTVSISGGQLDFLPTIAYLMGFESLDTVYLGHNLLTIDEGFVAEQTYMTKGSFFQDDIVYEMSRDGVFENGRAWNQRTGKKVSLEDCYEGYMRSMGIINTSEYILKNDVLRKIYEENQDAISAFSQSASEGMQYPKKSQSQGRLIRIFGTNSLEALNAATMQGTEFRINFCWTEDKKQSSLSPERIGRHFDNTKAARLPRKHSISEYEKRLDILEFLTIGMVKERPCNDLCTAERSQDYS